jgi:hypothetical protein
MKIHFLIALVIGMTSCKQNNNNQNTAVEKDDAKQ